MITGKNFFEESVEQHLAPDLVRIDFVQGAVAHHPPERQTVQEHDLSLVHLKSLCKPVRKGFQGSSELIRFIDRPPLLLEGKLLNTSKRQKQTLSITIRAIFFSAAAFHPPALFRGTPLKKKWRL
ncbi:MAG: hypothetical protein PVI27_11470 [Desulfobacteraceae bacterium]